MKKKLGNLARVLVAVAILTYLFNKIFRQEAEEYFTEHKINAEELTWQERARIVWTVGPKGLWEVIHKADPMWMAGAVACIGVVCMIGIVRWQMILRVQGLELPLARVTSIFFVGQFFNAFMLGSTGGDVVKAWYVAHDTHHKKAEAVATVVVDRLIGLLGLFVLTLVMMGIYWHRVFDDPRLITFSILTLGFVLACIAITVLGFW